MTDDDRLSGGTRPPPPKQRGYTGAVSHVLGNILRKISSSCVGGCSRLYFTDSWGRSRKKWRKVYAEIDLWYQIDGKHKKERKMAVKKHGLGADKNAPDNLGVLSYYLNTSKVYTLSPPELIKWCKTIVLLLSKLNVPKETTELIKFFTIVQNVEDYLKKMVMDIEPMSKGALLFSLLKQLFTIASKATPQTNPAVTIVLSLLNSSIRSVAVRLFIRQGTPTSPKDGNTDGAELLLVEGGPSSLVRVLITLCKWLCYWEGTPSLEQWIISFMKALEESKKYDILLDVSTAVVGDMFDALHIPSVRAAVVNVFLHILASTRDSIDTFDKIADQVPKVLEGLASDTSPESRSVLQNLVEAFTALLDMHPVYKEQYSNIVNCLDSHIKSNNCFILEMPIWKKDDMEGSSSRRAVTKVGLLNLGNTCYMNSALQALFMTKQFSNGIVMSNLKFPLLCKLKSLFAHMMFCDIEFLNPRELYNCSKPTNFARGTQQDTSEFINHLLTMLHEIESYSFSLRINTMDVFKAGKGNIQLFNTELEDSSDSLDTVLANDGAIAGSAAVDINIPSSSQAIKWVATEDRTITDDGRRKRNLQDMTDQPIEKRRCFRPLELPTASQPPPPTIVQKVFAGVMNTSICCLKCNQVSSKKDGFWDLQLSFPERQDQENYSISNLLEYYCSAEKLENDNRYRCQNCNDLQDAERSVCIETAPKNLILVLKQFFYDPKRQIRAKLMHRVKLNKYVTLNERQTERRYELYGVIVHTGVNLDSGHYYTMARDTPTTWYIFNDSQVRACTEQAIYSLDGLCTPYIIFYKRIDAPNALTSKVIGEDTSDSSSSVDEDFDPTEDAIPISFLPAHLLRQLKRTSMTKVFDRFHQQQRLPLRRLPQRITQFNGSRCSSSDDEE